MMRVPVVTVRAISWVVRASFRCHPTVWDWLVVVCPTADVSCRT
jgi:hypothetical protein